MTAIEIIVIVMAAAIVVGYLTYRIVRKIKGKPAGECADCGGCCAGCCGCAHRQEKPERKEQSK